MADDELRWNKKKARKLIILQFGSKNVIWAVRQPSRSRHDLSRIWMPQHEREITMKKRKEN